MGLLFQLGAITPMVLNMILQIVILFMPQLKTNEFWRLGTQPPDFSTQDFIEEMYKKKIGIQIAGFIICAIFMDYIGRKITYQLSILAGIISFIIFCFAEDVPTIKIAMLIAALFSGSAIYLSSIIIGEYSTPKFRGIFLLLLNLASAVGFLIGTYVIAYIPYKAVGGIGATLLIVTLVLIQIFPESPMWLALKQRYEESEQAFYKLRGDDEESVKEIKDLISVLQERDEKLSVREHIRRFMTKFINPEFLKPCGIMVLAVVLVEMSGKNFFYLYVYRGSLTSGDIPEFTFTLMVVARSLAALVSIAVVYFGRRRTLTLTTGPFACFLLFLIIVFTAIMNKRIGIIVSFLAIYKFLIDLFCTPLPTILMGELFPLEHKGAGMVVTGLVSQLMQFAVWESLEVLLAHPFWMLLMYTVLMGICLTLLYYVLPETKDMTLLSIEKKFVKETRKKPDVAVVQHKFELGQGHFIRK